MKKCQSMQWCINCPNGPSLHLNTSHALYRCTCIRKFVVFEISAKLSNKCTIFILEEGIIHSDHSYLLGKRAPGALPGLWSWGALQTGGPAGS